MASDGSVDSASFKDPQIARYEFKRALEELRGIKGRATELVSLYVPPGRAISDVSNYLRNEYAQSSNIKSRTTRKNVMWAIESLLGKLKTFKEPPENGVVFFVGTRALSGDQSEPVSYVIIPPEPINTYLYRCDSEFFLKPLEDMLAEKETYGLIVIDRKEATIGLVKGKRIQVQLNLQSQVPSKHGRGGQSQRRFERLIEDAANEFYKRVADHITELWLPILKDIKGVLIGGPGYTKVFFYEQDYLHHEIKKKVVDTFDTGYTDEYGLKELVEKASEAIEGMSLAKEKKLVQRLMKEVIKPDSGLSAYGEDEVRHFLQIGAVDTLLISEALRKYRIKLKCPSCGFEEKEITVTDPN
ncbi:MAG: peptide chain release factor aRF-1, partial [Thermoplasmata archaeon]